MDDLFSYGERMERAKAARDEATSRVGRKRIAYKHTSREAYEGFMPVSGELDLAIIAAIRDAGPDGIICEQIERVIGRKHQAVSGNLRHLVERGHVKHNGQYGKTASNRKAMKWVLVDRSEVAA